MSGGLHGHGHAEAHPDHFGLVYLPALLFSGGIPPSGKGAEMELHGGEPDQLDLLHPERSLAVEATSPRLHQLLMRTNGRPVSLKIKKILIPKN